MILSAAAALLGDQARVFTDVYKQYAFRDDQTLSEYLEFILHEPVAWFEGLPGTMKSKASIARPKTAVCKLVKCAEVIAALGAEVCEHVHSVLWATFKAESERIAAKRSGHEIAETGAETPGIEHYLAQDLQETHEEPLLEVNELHIDASDAASFHSVKGKRTMSYEHKYKVVDNALRLMVRNDLGGSGACINALLDALRDA
jgi:hypothetical protein